MKLNSCILLFLSLFFLQSCLKEEADIFGESSAERLLAAQIEYEELLNSAENGWVMDYFAGGSESMLGGFQILCRFEKGKVTMAGAFTMGDYKTMGEQIESSYTINRMQGPTLSFATYNTVLHPYADPGTSILNPIGYEGDFEFVIMKATKDEIVMRGIKEKHSIVMRPMEVGKDWNEYCEEVKQMEEKLLDYSRFAVNKAGQQIGYLTIWPGDKEMHDTDQEDIVVSKYTVSNRGINLYDSLSVSDNTLKQFVWDDTKARFTDINPDSQLDLSPVQISYEQLLGTYKVTADNFDEPITVTFTAEEYGKTIRVSKEFLGDYEFILEVYDNNKLGIKTQMLEKDEVTGHYIKLAVATKTNIIFGTTTAYNTSYPYSGSWYRFTADKPEIRFLPTSYVTLIFPTHVVGVRVVEFDKNSTANNDIVKYHTLIISNPVFVKQ